MNKRRFSIFTCLVLVVAALFLGVDQGRAQPPKNDGLVQDAQSDVQSTGQGEQEKTHQQRRQEANDRLKAFLEGGPITPAQPNVAVAAPLVVLPGPYPPGIGFNPLVNYNDPNYANSPNLRKFVDSLPGLGLGGCTPGTGVSPNITGGTCNQNNLGQYIPVANPDTISYPLSDYYEIGLAQYNKQMHRDLPATKLRGYVQINNGTNPSTLQNTVAPAPIHYLGPLIIANRDRAVRLKFRNQLGINGAGDLPLPVDIFVMGAGMGPIAGEDYTQNRADIHLHGGFTPWISDGTPHQWVTPAGDVTNYKKGVSFQNVPDMVYGSVVNGAPVPCVGGATCFTPAVNDGIGTYYYPNQQSARLMFYHDHAYGITRLNVYAGEAAGYLLTDQVEEDLIVGTNVSHVFDTVPVPGVPKQILPDLGVLIPAYHYGIPLIIQDKTFVNDDSTALLQYPLPAGYTLTSATATVDPRWTALLPSVGGGNFWLPHEYMPNENIYDPLGYNPRGRWDYAPFMIPPMLVQNLTLPSPTIVPEAFMDTPIVNGTPYPFVTLPPTAVRFRILNACNDRMLNLQLYYAATATGTICRGGAVPVQSLCTEVSMVPAAPSTVPGYPATWPVDGRPGGVPDPTTVGPDIWQIGNEAGFLAQVAVIPPQPVDFDYSRRSVTFGGVTSKALYLPPAVRADVIVDFGIGSGVMPGDTLILYNDAPAPMPLYDTRYDYFTDDPDLTAIGGAPSTPAGFGPNTRTVMQIRIDPAGVSTTAFDLPALQAALPKAFAVAQDPPLVPQAAYNAAYGTAYLDVNGGLTVFANSVDETLNVTALPSTVARVMTTLPGLGYIRPPVVNFVGGGCTTIPAATATLNGVTGVTLVTAGAGCTTAPTVTLTGGGGTGATAAATISGSVVTVISITNPGSNYTTAPRVALAGGCATAPTAVATITLGSVGAINLTNSGANCTKAPYVFLTGGGGTGAAASAMLVGDKVLNGKNLVEGFDMEYGRMNAVLGSTPNPLAPTVGAGPVIGMARYIDPPTEVLNAGETVLWRLTHIGVDSHAIHFHLFNVQVINRVDWTNTIKPPYDEELGWKETIRTNPFEDIILAIRPVSMSLPFPIPQSNRLLDPTTPAGSTVNFLPVAPPIGVPAVAQTTNVMTNFGWEYVWHCHLLGHEENDMMRPLVLLVVPPAKPTTLTARASILSSNPPTVALAWRDNSTNEDGFTIQRARDTGFITELTEFTVGPNVMTYTDTTVLKNTRYYYRVRAFNTINTIGNSAWSNTATVMTPGQLPAAPTGLATGAVTSTSVVLNWTALVGDQTGFVIQRATNAGFTTGLARVTVNTPALTTYTLTSLRRNTLYYFSVAAKNAAGTGPYSNVVSATTLP